MLYAVCEKLARARPSWFVSRADAASWHKDWRNGHADRLADRLHSETWRADRGANLTAAGRDQYLMRQLSAMHRADWSPAEALRYIFPEDFK